MVNIGLFHSNLKYGIILWGQTPGCKEVLRLQNIAVREITFSGYLDHCKPLFRRLRKLDGLVPLHLVYIRDNQSSQNTREEIHSQNTRGRCELDKPHCRLSKTQWSGFPVLASKMLNRLPIQVKLLDKGRFIKVLKTWLVDAAYYLLDEWLENSLLGQVLGYQWVKSTCRTSESLCSKSYKYIFYIVIY